MPPAAGRHARTPDGVEFLGCERQVAQQADLLEQRYLCRKPARRLCAISTQHDALAVNAFVNMVERTEADEFALRETCTHDIIEDVATLRSDIGVLLRSGFNRKVLDELFRDRVLVLPLLFTAVPHVSVACGTPSPTWRPPPAVVRPGEHDSFFLAEEILSTEAAPKTIRVSDRATIFNLMIGLDGYRISAGILNADLNGDQIVSVPFAIDDPIEVGWIGHAVVQRAEPVRMYLDELARVIGECGADDARA